MAPPSNDKEYFLGIEGERIGPFSESLIVQKIGQGSVPESALIWAEGMADWAPIQSVPSFDEAFSKDASPKPFDESSAPHSTPQAPAAQERARPQVKMEKLFEPVFQPETATEEASFVKNRIVFISAGIAFVFMASIGGFVWYATSNPSAAPVQAKLGQAKKGTTKKESVRQVEFNRAMSQLLLDPVNSIQLLRALAKVNPDDDVGQESVKTLLNHYERAQSVQDAGRFLMELKKPMEASKYFLKDPGLAREAESALYQAYQASKGPERKDLLLQNISVLLSPIRDMNRAAERIQAYEKEFPGQPHPYGYYSRTPDEKIVDLFNRISFYFVDNLLRYLNSELSSISFVERPLVEIKKTKTGEYRIVGNYKGEVVLNNDRLPNIYFTFWLVKENWVIVDTNLTKERQKFAAGERERRQKDTLASARMLDYMESIFQSQFPKSALHETVAPNRVPTTRAND